METSIIRTLPFKFVGALVLLLIASLVLYLIGVVSMYMIAWVVWVIQAIFG